MNCSQMEGLLLDFVTGRLAGADRASAEHHLTVCQDCRERAAGFRSVARVLEDWDTPEISPWFNARLRQRIAAEEALAWNWRNAVAGITAWLKQPVTAAAFAAVLVVGSLALWTSRPAPQPARQIAVQPVIQQKPQVDELLPVVEDFDMLADFEVIQDLKTASKAQTPSNKM